MCSVEVSGTQISLSSSSDKGNFREKGTSGNGETINAYTQYTILRRLCVVRKKKRYSALNEPVYLIGRRDPGVGDMTSLDILS